MYSVGDDVGRSNYAGGPTIYSNSGIVNNAYYFSDKIFNNTINEKVTMLALHDVEFQNTVLNADSAFDVNSTITKGYYPQLNMPVCMPKQEYIALPEVKDEDLPDILSTEILERDADVVKAKFTIHNPNAETITGINVKNLNCTIQNQEYSDGKSYVNVILDTPILYVSDYSVLSISAKGTYSKEYTRDFQENERIIKIEFFKKVYTIDDWKNINKYPNENYQLENDLDFKNATDLNITNTYTGIINGNGYQLKNIYTNTAIFTEVKGEIRNLVVNNLNISANSSNVGFINKLNSGKIDKVHVKNSNIETTEKAKNQDIYMGGIVANAENSDIVNSSVLNVNIKNNVELKTNIAGAVVGRANNSRIYNCWSQHINIEIENVLSSDGLGGIVGKLMNYSELKNCYSEGKIITESSSVGGIVGNVSSSVIKIYNTYSLVNIESEGEYIGGIVGITSAGYNIYNNIAIGNLYATQKTSYIGAINGDGVTFSNNYKYKMQLINGYESSITENVATLTRDELLNKSIYTDKVGFDENFNYEQLKDGILPKLMDTNKNEVLPYQENVLLIDDSGELKIGDITYQKEINKVTIRLMMQDNITVKNIAISDMEVNIINQVNRENNTYVDLEAVPIKYLDSYKISEINYEKNNEEKKKELGIKIDVSFYKEIYTYEDWQNIDENSYENYMLMQDIDFNGKTNIKYNLKINRLISEGKSLKNINLTSEQPYFGLIKQIKSELSGIEFDNINITNNKGTGDYLGIILFSSANISSIKLNDINLNAKNMNYVSPIGKSLNKIENVTLNNIEIYGKYYIGGLVSEIDQLGTINEVKGDTIKINATSDYVGSILGRSIDTSIAIENVSVTNANISGGNYVGGLTGYSSIHNSEIYDSDITGKGYVGGITGYLCYRNDTTARAKLIVDNCNISGTNSFLGGITGFLSNTGNVNGIVRNSVIEGLTTSSNSVGGIVGGSQYTMRYNAVIDTQIISKGSNVGGISGRFWSERCYYGLVVGCQIEGYSNVGGLIGYNYGDITGYLYNYVSSNIIATNSNAGGIVGKLPNKGMTGTYNTSQLTNNYFANGRIYAPTNVGGLIGIIDEELYKPDSYYYRNYVEADVSADNETNVSLGIGNMPNQNQYLADTYFYKYSTINGENPNTQNEIFISDDKYLTEEDLKKQTTYTSKLKWSSSYWNFNTLKNNKYPIINSSDLPTQEGIDIPKDSEHIVGNTESSIQTQNIIEQEEPEQTFEYNNKQIQTYSTFSVITDSNGGQVTRDTKLYVKDNNLYAIPSILTITTDNENITPVEDNLIIDSYNGKEYETILGSDGKLYDLKEPITYPEDFVNENIESIGNNLNNDSHEVEVTYKNGDKIKFNYQTGEVISAIETETEEQIGLFDYLKEKISTIGDTTSGISQELAKQYEESKELQTKLEETSVEEAIEEQNSNSNITNDNVTEETKTTETNNSLKENKYISMYNEETGQYEIYNEEELLDTSKEEVVSENEKIEANNLSEYYASEGKTKNTKMGIVWIVISIIGVGITLFVLGKKIGIRGRC